MKKFLAIILSASMLLSCAVLLAIPTSAVDGMWVVYGNAGDYRDGFDPEVDQYSCVPGYSYVRGEGLKVTPAGWSNTNPRVGVQTKEKIDMRNGVYMLVRVDEFSYEAGDKWFSFNIYDTKYVSVGSQDKAIDGEGITTLIRPTSDKQLTSIAWRYSNFQPAGSSDVSKDFAHHDADGKILLALEIVWDAASGYSMSVNGAPIHQTALNWMNEHFADGMAYVGFNMQNNEKGGTAACTVLEYGESKATALTPMGDDSAEPVDVDDEYEPAPIADSSSVPDGQPAIYMNGSHLESDSKNTLKNTDFTSLTEENYIHYVSDRKTLEIGMTVKNSVSYSINDFPILVVLTRNLCTCLYEMGSCFCFETCNIFPVTGDDIAPGDDRRINAVSVNKFSNQEVIEIGDDQYLYFTTNVIEESNWEPEGRINGIRFDVTEIDLATPGRNEFDVCFAAFFRNEDEAEAYISSFLSQFEPDDDQETDGQETNDQETDAATDAETDGNENVTNEPSANETEAQETEPQQTEVVTDPEDDDDQTGSNDNAGNNAGSDAGNEAEPGCFGTVGFGAIAMITLAAGVSFVAFKKKK